MTSQICVDAGILLKLVLREPDSHLAEALWQSWVLDGVQLIAPYLFHFEVTAVLRKVVHRGLISQEIGLQALANALEFDVTLQTFPDIHERAGLLATKLNRPTAYDTHYLALAERSGCDFWTADRRLYHATHQNLPWVHWLGETTVDNLSG